MGCQGLLSLLDIDYLQIVFASHPPMAGSHGSDMAHGNNTATVEKDDAGVPQGTPINADKPAISSGLTSALCNSPRGIQSVSHVANQAASHGATNAASQLPLVMNEASRAENQPEKQTTRHADIGRLIRERAPLAYNSALRTNPKHENLFGDLFSLIPSPSARIDAAAPLQLGPYMSTKLAESRDAKASQAQAGLHEAGGGGSSLEESYERGGRGPVSSSMPISVPCASHSHRLGIAPLEVGGRSPAQRGFPAAAGTSPTNEDEAWGQPMGTSAPCGYNGQGNNGEEGALRSTSGYVPAMHPYHTGEGSRKPVTASRPNASRDRQAGPVKYHGVRQRPSGKFAAEKRGANKDQGRWLGTSDTAEEAAIAYDTAARRIRGLSAITNFKPSERPVILRDGTHYFVDGFNEALKQSILTPVDAEHPQTVNLAGTSAPAWFPAFSLKAGGHQQSKAGRTSHSKSQSRESVLADDGEEGSADQKGRRRWASSPGAWGTHADDDDLVAGDMEVDFALAPQSEAITDDMNEVADVLLNFIDYAAPTQPDPMPTRAQRKRQIPRRFRD